MALFDSGQMNRMRQDAIRRSQEMHRRAAHYPQSERGDSRPSQEMGTSEVRTAHSGQNSILGGLAGDHDADKLLTAALLLLMLREGSDMRLILAIGYILL